MQKGIVNTFTGVKDRVQQTVSQKTPATPKTGDSLDQRTPKSKTESVPELIPPNTPSPELVEAAKADTATLELHSPTSSTQAQRVSEEKISLPVEEIAPPEEAPSSDPNQNS